ncbi:hypothetical protein, conserved [Eimeria praecox]|uniref:Uncharacterized protein n=1 Tax=Eimeria praecox TaxID=51316 RepID=U6H1E4_9EIME|nr:hypothetical protein, conserved [Eimeria praecox]
MEGGQGSSFSSVRSSVEEILATQSPSCVPFGYRMAAKEEEGGGGTSLPSPVAHREITYFPTGKRVLACGDDWELRHYGGISAASILSRLRQCLRIDQERMDMFKHVFQEEQLEFDRYLAYVENCLLLYPEDCMQTLPMVQSVVDELKAEIAGAHSSLQTVEGIAADVKERTMQLIKEYEDFEVELCSLQQRVSAAYQASENRNCRMFSDAESGTEEEDDHEGNARLALIGEAVSAKEREQRRQLTLLVTENKRMELVEVGNSVFPSSLSALACRRDEQYSTAGEGLAAPPPTPNPEFENFMLLEQAFADVEPHAFAIFQQPDSPPQQREMNTETVLVEDQNEGAWKASASTAIRAVSVEAPGAVSELPGTLVPRKPHEIRRGRPRYRRLNPLGQAYEDNCCHGDPTFVYSADESSPPRSSDRTCSAEKEDEPQQHLRCKSSPHGTVAASSLLDLHSSTY